MKSDLHILGKAFKLTSSYAHDKTLCEVVKTNCHRVKIQNTRYFAILVIVLYRSNSLLIQ